MEFLPWKFDWTARIKSFSKTQCCFSLVLCMFCLFHVFILLKCWHLAENMLLFPKVPLILWIGYKPSTRCGRVHFEHSHRKWLVITVRPTTSVRESPQKNLPPRNTPDSFCRRFTRQNHRCAAWAVFFFFGKLYLESCISRLNVIPTFRQRHCKTRAGTSFGANGDPLTWAETLYLFFVP